MDASLPSNQASYILFCLHASCMGACSGPAKHARCLLISFRDYGPPKVDRIGGIWGSQYNMPKAIFYLREGDYKPQVPRHL